MPHKRTRRKHQNDLFVEVCARGIATILIGLVLIVCMEEGLNFMGSKPNGKALVTEVTPPIKVESLVKTQMGSSPSDLTNLSAAATCAGRHGNQPQGSDKPVASRKHRPTLGSAQFTSTCPWKLNPGKGYADPVKDLEWQRGMNP